MDNPAIQDNSELSTKHRKKKTGREIKNGQSSDTGQQRTKHKTQNKENRKLLDCPFLISLSVFFVLCFVLSSLLSESLDCPFFISFSVFFFVN
jgi:hypothetical protein